MILKFSTNAHELLIIQCQKVFLVYLVFEFHYVPQKKKINKYCLSVSSGNRRKGNKPQQFCKNFEDYESTKKSSLKSFFKKTNVIKLVIH